MRLIRLIIVFLPLIHYFTSYKKVNSNSLFSGTSIIWTSESQCLLTPFFVFFIFFHFTSAQQISGCRCGQEPVSLPVEIF